eukprot:CFRG5380T1
MSTIASCPSAFTKCRTCNLNTDSNRWKTRLVKERDMFLTTTANSLRERRRRAFINAAETVGLSTRTRQYVHSSLIKLAVRRGDTPVEKLRNIEVVYVSYLPCTKAQLIDYLELAIEPEHHQDRFEMARLITAYITQQSYKALTMAKSHYTRMDPDVDRWYAISETDEETFHAGGVERQREFFAQLEELLNRANYFEITDEVIGNVQRDRTGAEAGLDVHVALTDYPLLRMWAQCRTVSVERYANGKVKEYTSLGEIYKRVFIAVKVKDQDEEEDIYLKLAKNVKSDRLASLLPNAQPVMTPFDKAMLAMLGTSAIGLLVTRCIHWLNYQEPIKGLLMVSGGLAFAAVRTYQRYSNRRAKYSEKLIKNLHFNTLANNRAALSHLADMANIENFKGIFLAYWFAYTLQERNENKMVEKKEVEQAVEAWVHRTFKVNFDYDMATNVSSLERIGLLLEKKVVNDELLLRVMDPTVGRAFLQELTACPSWFGIETDDE